MHITLVMVSSVNGKITKGYNPDVSTWTSDEDAALFEKLKKQFPLIIMGRKTYDAARSCLVLKSNVLRVVLTKNPDAFKKESVVGQLEFTNESPLVLLQRLENEGHKKALLVGGGEVNAAFFAANLVNEIHLTLEPLMFMTGSDLVHSPLTGSDPVSGIALKLVAMEKLNDRGTLQLVYEVIK